MRITKHKNADKSKKNVQTISLFFKVKIIDKTMNTKFSISITIAEIKKAFCIAKEQHILKHK